MNATTILPGARPPLVLTDLIPRRRAVDVALVLAGAGLTTLGAQISIETAASPVPITGQTLGVMLAAGALGARRGALSQLVYLLVGLVAPVFAGHEHGWDVITGATGGYLVGFVLAAAVVGRLAEDGADRRPLTAAATFAFGQLTIFAVGVPWLKAAAGLDWSTAIHEGFTIFIAGGVIKAALGGLITPTAWRLARAVKARGR